MRNVTSAIQTLTTRFGGPISAIETGTIRSYDERHESTRLIAQALAGRGRLISVDNSPKAIAISKAICRGAANVTWVQSDTLEFLKTPQPDGYHFALLDSANRKDWIFQEFELLAPLMIESGILIVDDAGITVDGRRVDRSSRGEKGHRIWEFLQACGARFCILATPVNHHTQLRIDWTTEARTRVLDELARRRGGANSTAIQPATAPPPDADTGTSAGTTGLASQTFPLRASSGATESCSNGTLPRCDLAPAKERAICNSTAVIPPLWKPEDLSLVFVTCPRNPSYFATTLASALMGDPSTMHLQEIVVAVDAANLDCVAPLTNHQRIRWVPRDSEENKRAESYRVHRRACHNYWRALRLFESKPRAFIVCEDDLIFRDGWLGMLLDSLNEMWARGLREFILTAYSAYDHEQRSLRRGEFYSSYPADSFFGTQAMIYPAGELALVRDLIWKCGVNRCEAPYDMLIKRRAIGRQHLYCTRHSLVQHAGDVSTGLGGGHHSPSFGRPWSERQPKVISSA